MNQVDQITARTPMSLWTMVTWPAYGRDTQVVAVVDVVLVALVILGVRVLRDHPWIGSGVLFATALLFLLIGFGIAWFEQKLNQFDDDLSRGKPTSDMFD